MCLQVICTNTTVLVQIILLMCKVFYLNYVNYVQYVNLQIILLKVK